MITSADFLKWLEIFGVPNNGGGITPGNPYLIKANDLSDVASVPSSRTNLSVPATSSYAGNPNGNVAGALGDFVLDSGSDNQLWLCTTAGNAADAVWSLQTPAGTYLLKANDLSDVDSVPTSRTNLSVPATSIYAGNPNGNVAGALGDFVLDLSLIHI